MIQSVPKALVSDIQRSFKNRSYFNRSSVKQKIDISIIVLLYIIDIAGLTKERYINQSLTRLRYL